MITEFFYPLGKDPENEPVLSLLPQDYKSAAILFYPFIRMPEKYFNSNFIDKFPSDDEIFDYGSPVSWKEIVTKSGLKDIPELSIAIKDRVTGGAGRKMYQRPDLRKCVDKAIVAENLFYPTEDMFSVLIMKDILKIIGSNGSKKVIFAKLIHGYGEYALKDLTKENILNLCSEPITIMDENGDFMFTCFYDEVNAVFFSKLNIKDILDKTNLEGTILGEDHPIVWEEQVTHTYFNKMTN